MRKFGYVDRDVHQCELLRLQKVSIVNCSKAEQLSICENCSCWLINRAFL